MPRPRVKPADRTRAAKACMSCKASKKRCDANLPCRLCVTKGRGEACTYPDEQRREKLPSRIPWNAPLSPAAEGGLSSPVSRRPIEPAHFQQLLSDELPSFRNSVAETRESSPQNSQRPTMLLSSRGEQVYIGNVAAISFLQFLQKTLKRYIGPSSFTERQRSDTMLEAELQNGSVGNFEDDLGPAEKRDLYQCFARASSGILHLFSEEDITRLLGLERRRSLSNENLNLEPQREDLACLYLMIAIGAQSRGRDQEEIKRSGRYFARAQQMSFVGMLQDPSLGMITIFLLMAMYMLGACRRNTAFMYIGVASKAATILGLHMPYQHVRASAEERVARRRTWMSLRVLDLLCSSILARPSSTPSIQRDEYEIDNFSNDDKDHRTLALSANYESSSIIDAIVQNFARSSSIDIRSAENYLQMLREWSQALPEALRKAPRDHDESMRSDSDSREITIGNIHVSCTYYFGVILVTRQFLISRVMSQLRGRRSSGTVSGDGVQGDAVGEREQISQFSDGCISSASYMAQLCYEASNRNILLDNMCILKAWLFSAGLVLGFSLLLDRGDWLDTREAFSRAREVLNKLARLSPQAKQYYDILTSFSNAIELYRQQLSLEQKHSSNPYVEKIMAIGMFDEVCGGWEPQTRDQVQMHTPPRPLTTPDPSDFCDDITAILTSESFEIPGFATQIEDDIGLQLIWDSCALQLPSFAA